MPIRNYNDYQSDVTEDIVRCLEEMGCQPILFVGSGLTQRYVKGPSWHNLLNLLCTQCPKVENPLAYYMQFYRSFPQVGSEISKAYQKWAWGDGKNQFPSELFTGQYRGDIYIKHRISSIISSYIPSLVEQIGNSSLSEEIKSLISVRPHAIITTNYDNLMELIYPEYTPIIGQKVIRSAHITIGEILKIHGCVSDPTSIVFTEEDYQDFQKKRKYLSAKLLTYFAEHPLLFVGYSAEDPNIKSILGDIGEIISSENDLIPNIYLIEWKSDVNENSYPPLEKIISVDNDKTVRVKCIVANDFSWIFRAFSTDLPIAPVSPKLLRALMARQFELFRCDLPRRKIDIDFETLERAANIDGELAKLYGITMMDDGSQVNQIYPYSSTEVAEKLGYNHWHIVDSLIKAIKNDHNIDIRASDNSYHIFIKSGKKSGTRKYSRKAVDLFRNILNEKQYEIEL